MIVKRSFKVSEFFKSVVKWGGQKVLRGFIHKCCLIKFSQIIELKDLILKEKVTVVNRTCKAFLIDLNFVNGPFNKNLNMCKMKSLFSMQNTSFLFVHSAFSISDLDLVLQMFLVFVSLSYPPFIYRLNFKLGFYLNNAILSYIFFVWSFYHYIIHFIN